MRARLVHLYGQQTHEVWVEKSGISQGTLGRALNAATGLTLDSLEIVAKGCRLAPYQLLIYMPDPANPGIVIGAGGPDEILLWEQFIQIKKTLAKS